MRQKAKHSGAYCLFGMEDAAAAAKSQIVRGYVERHERVMESLSESIEECNANTSNTDEYVAHIFLRTRNLLREHKSIMETTYERVLARDDINAMLLFIENVDEKYPP